MKKSNQIEDKNLISMNIDDIIMDSMQEYGLHLVFERALPSAIDGLTPVQRKILYGAHETNMIKMTSTARLVGEVLGKFHPHSDASVFKSAVSLIKPWNNSISLIEGEGNFGSIDGDSPAAMRYTKLQISDFANFVMFDEINYTNYMKNYDDTMNEPMVLPCKFPNVFLNGLMGIALGFATNIPPHNLNDIIDTTIAYVKNRKISIEEIINTLKAPDYPTGGIICGTNSVHRAYKYGYGAITLRGSHTYNKFSHMVTITSLPYNVYKSTAPNSFMVRVKELCNNEKIFLKNIVDNSKSDTNIKIDLHLDEKQDYHELMNILYKSCGLQTKTPMMINTLYDGVDIGKSKDIREIFKHWLLFREEILNRKFKDEFDKYEAELHKYEGLLKIYPNHIDETIKIIRAATEMNSLIEKLMKTFKLSKAQAEFIISLRLHRLSKFNMNDLLKKVEDLKVNINNLKPLLETKHNNKHVDKYIIKELVYIKDTYGYERRTVIGEEELVKIEGKSDRDIPSSNTTVVIMERNNNYYIKRVNNYDNHSHDINYVNKEECIIRFMFKCKTDDKIVLYTKDGKAFSMLVYDIDIYETEDRGRLISTQFNNIGDDTIVYAHIYDNINIKLLDIYTSNGYVKTIDYNLLESNKKSSKTIIKLEDDDEVIEVIPRSKDAIEVMLVSKMSNISRISIKDYKVTGLSAKGIIAMRLREDDKLVSANNINKNNKNTCTIITDNGHLKHFNVTEVTEVPRGNFGIMVFNRNKEYGNVLKAFINKNNLILCINNKNKIFKISSSSIKVSPKTSKPKLLEEVINETIIKVL